MELRVVDRSTLLEAPEKMLVAWLGEVKLKQNLQSFLLELAMLSSRSPANIARATELLTPPSPANRAKLAQALALSF